MTANPISTRVIIAGVEARAGTDDLRDGRPTILDGLNFSWGRSSIVDQPGEGTAAFTVRQELRSNPATTLFDQLNAGAPILIRSTAPSGRDVICWAGEVASATVQQVSDYALQAEVSCVDPSALLSNMTIGDEPWPAEPAGDRLARIVDLAGAKIPALSSARDFRATIAPSIAGIQVVGRDIDSQEPYGLLQGLAASIGGVAWLSADETGPIIWIEDATNRPANRRFVRLPDGTITVDTANPDVSVPRWSAADLLRDPITWTQDPTQAITTVDVGWQDESLDEDGERTVEEYSKQRADTRATGTYGLRRLQIGTELADGDQADLLAAHTLAQARSATWIISGLAIDTVVLTRPLAGFDDVQRVDQAMTLLDHQGRLGAVIAVDDFPDWSPTDVQTYYVEGGEYTWENGRWRMDLTASANAIGDGATYAEMPADISWTDMDPAVTWIDAYGAAAPTGGV